MSSCQLSTSWSAILQAHRLVIEQDDALLEADRGGSVGRRPAAGATRTLTYEHLPPRSEPLLWIPDTEAWCWARNGRWRDRIRPLVLDVTRV